MRFWRAAPFKFAGLNPGRRENADSQSQHAVLRSRFRRGLCARTHSPALGLMLGAEFTFAAWLRGLSVWHYLAGRDPVAGTVYYAMLGLFAIMPLLVARRSTGAT